MTETAAAVRNNAARSRFELDTGDGIAFLSYHATPGVLLSSAVGIPSIGSPMYLPRGISVIGTFLAHLWGPVYRRVCRIPAFAPCCLRFVQAIASPLVRPCSPSPLVVLHHPEPRLCTVNRAGGVAIDSANFQRSPVRVFVDDAVVGLRELVGPQDDGSGEAHSSKITARGRLGVHLQSSIGRQCGGNGDTRRSSVTLTCAPRFDE
jgi:hypothetical protein